MQGSNWHIFATSKDDAKFDTAEHETPEDLVDRFGIKMSLLVLCAALFMAALWVVNHRSFEGCSTLSDVTERNACYNELRNELLKPPAKGADVKLGQ